MLKKILTFAVVSSLFFSFIGCLGYGQIKITNDSFTNSKIITLLLANNSQEKMYHFFRTRCDTKFIRKISIDNEENYVKLTLRVSEKFEDLKPKAFFKIDNTKIPATVSNIKSELKTTTSTRSKTKYDFKPSTIDSSIDGTATTESRTTTSTSKILHGKIIISPEIKDAILNGSTFTIRIYSGLNPLTFVINKKNLSKLKTFFTTTGEKK